MQPRRHSNNDKKLGCVMRRVGFYLISATGRRISGALVGICCAVVFAQTRPLNDTGITFCGNASRGNNSPCLGTEPAGQDKHYGRDAAALAGTLNKVGGSGGNNGFDYSKISNSGAVLPATAALGSAPDEWACTRDNVTGLLWEVKTTSGLRDESHAYSWYMTGDPDGVNGAGGDDVCYTPQRCDTEKFMFDVNIAGLCGFNAGWRLPTIRELNSIVDFGRFDPAIDPKYFPNSRGSGSSTFWSSSIYSNGASEQRLASRLTDGASRDFYIGYPPFVTHLSVRLVRSGP
jgi:hypothetical protein